MSVLIINKYYKPNTPPKWNRAHWHSEEWLSSETCDSDVGLVGKYDFFYYLKKKWK